MDIITRNNVENLKNGLIKFQLNNNNFNKNNCNHNNNNNNNNNNNTTNNNFINYKNINNNNINNGVTVDGGGGGGGGGGDGGGGGIDYPTTDNLKCNGHIEIDTNCNGFLEQRQREKCAERTVIQEFYNKKNILVTGGTGFMGKMLIEKLLRSCPDIENIYMLVRPKKGKDIHTRLDEIFDDQVYSTVREQVPKFRHKIVAIPGDCAVAGLGLKLLDRQTLIENVNIIFHAAATVRFDEKLRLAININVHGTKELLNLCTHMKNLNVMMHISTAYSNCHLYYIEEKFYKYPFHFDDVNRLIDKLDDKSLDEATPTVLGKWPNTYAFTKALAEEMIRKNCHNLPIGMFRPAIVTSTIKEPVVGWIDNLYGPTGVVAGVGTGVLRTMHCDKDIVANIVPVDMTVNALIASAWDVATNFYNCNNNSRSNFNNINNNYNNNNNIKVDDSNYVINDSNDDNNDNDTNNNVDNGGTTIDSNNNNNNIDNNNCNNNCNNNATNDEIIPIYNYVSSVENPLTWGRFTELNITYGFDYPFSSAIWYLSFHMHKTAMMNKIYMIFLHILPAMLFDSLAICVGQRPQLLKAYKKIHKFSSVISFFCTNEWLFTNDNVQCLWKKLSERDQEQFGFNMKTIDWKEYAHYYIKGMRLYLFKDDLTTVESARKKWNRFYWLHQLLKGFFLFLIMFLLWSTFSHYIYHIF